MTEARVDRAVRVLVADNSRMASELLAGALERDPLLQVVGICAGGGELPNGIASDVDVLVISATLGTNPTGGLDTCRRIRSVNAKVAVVVLIEESTSEMVTGSFAAGARGIFSRTQPLETLIKCVHAVHSGQVWANSNEMRLVLDTFAEATPKVLTDSKGVALLSKREQEVVRCVTEGLSNREIAARLKLSEHTIKNYIFRIFDKLGVSTRVEMVLYAFSQTPRIEANRLRGSSGTQGNAPPLPGNISPPETGDPLAHLQLALKYRLATALERNNVLAAMELMLSTWIADAAVLKARALLCDVTSEMSAADVQAAEAKARLWLEQHSHLGELLCSTPKPADVERRPQSYDDGIRVELPRHRSLHGPSTSGARTHASPSE